VVSYRRLSRKAYRVTPKGRGWEENAKRALAVFQRPMLGDKRIPHNVVVRKASRHPGASVRFMENWAATLTGRLWPNAV
jgi:hypothetical protein